MNRHAMPLFLMMFLAAGVHAGDTVPVPPADPTADRRAILAMQGEYAVDFAFDETVLLQPGYERASAMRSAASETVVVVEDGGTGSRPMRIVLQHLLVDRRSGHVTKHWRQDWTYEASERFEFTAHQTWRMVPIAADTTRGAWTQCVYEVSDAPRYCGTGRWNHRYGVATWTSDRTWRPLPRREYTRRDDYNALNVENRHTIVPGGWTHEQDNTKTVRADDGSTVRTIARESGFNDYRRGGDTDFAPAYAYWDATKMYWVRVRARWQRAFATHGGVQLMTPVDGMPIVMATFQHADRVVAGEEVGEDEITRVFDSWVAAPPAVPVAAAAAR